LFDTERFCLHRFHDKNRKKMLQQNETVSRQQVQLMEYKITIYRNTLRFHFKHTDGETDKVLVRSTHKFT
jgi:coenzyme F420-reducing hydrogenase beta subunit